MSDTPKIVSDPAAALSGAGAGGCCGNPPRADLNLPDPAVEAASPCCGTTAEAKAESSCCGAAAKQEAVSTGQGCCG